MHNLKNGYKDIRPKKQIMMVFDHVLGVRSRETSSVCSNIFRVLEHIPYYRMELFEWTGVFCTQVRVLLSMDRSGAQL